MHIKSEKVQVKFRYCVKATKFEKIFHFFWRYYVISKKMGDFFKLFLHLLCSVKQIFVAFSEKLNFTKEEPSLKVTFFAVSEMINQPKL